MKKSLFLSVCALSFMLSSNLQAFEIKTPDLGAVKNITSSVSGTAAQLTSSSVKSSVTSINTKLTNADKTVQTSFNALVSALASKEEATKLKTQINAINANKNLSASEKSAKIAQVMSDYGTSLKEEKDKLATQLQKASDAKKTQITNAVVALATASYQYLDIANDATNLAMNVASSPTLAVSCANELSSLKETGKILKNNAKSLKDVTTQAVAVAKAGGINIKLPKSNATKAKSVSLTK